MAISRAILAFVVISFAVASTTKANPITWTLTGVTFSSSGGGGLTGSFVYDADTNTYSSVNLTSINGGSFTFLDTPPGGFGADSSNQLAVFDSSDADHTDTDFVFLFFANVLTDAGGTDRVFDSGVQVCNNNTCSDGSGLGFGDTGNVVSQAATPEPSTGLMVISVGLLCIAGGRFRRRFKVAH
jgi:hypothetical protein